MKELKNEKLRTYVFTQDTLLRDEKSYTIEDPISVEELKNGNHSVLDDEGCEHEVREGWLAIRKSPKKPTTKGDNQNAKS